MNDGLFGPGSVAWELCRERSVAAMAPRAMVLQYAHPAFAAASGAYAAGPARPGSRFDRALRALSTIVFADDATARTQAHRVERMHAHLHGRAHDGTPWSASDPEALAWVLVTLLDGTLRGAELVRGRLPEERVAGFFTEAVAFGRLFGVRPVDVPRDRAALDARVDDAVRTTLVVGPELRDVWRYMLESAGPAGPLLRRWVAATLPPPLAVALGVPGHGRWLDAGRAIGRVGACLPGRFRFTALYRSRSGNGVFPSR